MTANPYSCTRPGSCFVGYQMVRRKMLRGLRDGNSFAVLGGRRCGKTSLLLELAKDIEGGGLDGVGLAPLRALPRYLDLQSLNEVTPGSLFGAIYDLAVQGTSAPRREVEAELDYRSFLKKMETSRPEMESAYGVHWLVVLLIDELDSAVARLPDDQFFQNLRNLLMVSTIHRHFRVVASGVKAMCDLISSGSSPLNNLRHIHLGILSSGAADDLVAMGFGDGSFDAETNQALQRITGRHPYLMQGLLELLWNYRNCDGAELGSAAMESAVRQFQREHSDFRRWLDAFGPTEHVLYQALTALSDGDGDLATVSRRIPPEHRPNLEEALTVLAYHGLLDDSDPDRPRVAGTFFRDWYRRHDPTGAVPGATQQRKKLFVSYSHRDGAALARLQVHLKPLEDEIDLWDDTRLVGGDRWAAEISAAVDGAEIAILLISADFLASSFIVRRELPSLLRAAMRDGATILPVIVGPCSYEQHAILRDFQSLNPPNRPLSGLPRNEREKVWQQLAQRVREILGFR
jgi:hypothetical protein